MQNKAALYVGAFLWLIVMGIGAYFATGFFVKPKTLTITEQQSGLSKTKVKELLPQDVSITMFNDHIEMTFTTKHPCFSYLYITFDAKTPFLDVLETLKRGEKSEGLWFSQQEVNEDIKHTIIIPRNKLPSDKEKAYLYVLVKWQKYYIPYGEQTSLATGPLTPWIISLNQ